jgi:hypothetical protein
MGMPHRLGWIFSSRIEFNNFFYHVYPHIWWLHFSHVIHNLLLEWIFLCPPSDKLQSQNMINNNQAF